MSSMKQVYQTDDIIYDDGEPFPLADTAGGDSISVSAAKPVATIATLADYLVNGFWAYNNALSHHWASMGLPRRCQP